jgi:putative sigma-54 modulation protein
MQIKFTARHFKASESLKDYAENEIQRLQKFFDRIVDCDIILVKERNNLIADISLNVSSGVLAVKESSEDFYKSIDKAVDKLERQIKKYKGKNRNYKHDKINDVLETPEIIEQEKT